MKHPRCSSMLAVFFFVLSCLLIAEAFAADVPKMSKEDLQAKLGNPDVIIIDVRSEGDWTSSNTKIKGAIREDPPKVSSWMEKYPKDKTLVFYCS
jgi:hypothetical protein